MAFALASSALPAALALDVGEPRVRSGLGQPLDASLPVRANPGERFAGKCFSVAPGAGIPEDPDLGVTLERSQGRANLRVRTGKPIEEPAIGLRVGVDCEKPADQLKDVPLLIDPPRVGRRPAPTTPVAQPAAAPSAAAERAPAPIAKPARPPAPAKAPPAAPRSVPSATAPAKAAPKPPAASTAAPFEAAPAKPAPRPAAGGFQLRLSTGEMDLSPSKRIDDRQREQLRGRLALLDSDDQLSAMLAMRHQLQQLESKVAALQLKVSQMPANFPPPKTEVKGEAKGEARPAPPKVEAPKVEAPKVEAPKVEAPKVEAPKVEAPRVEAPKVEAPRVEAPKVEAPKVEAPKIEAPKVEAPKPKPLSARPAPPPERGFLDDIVSTLASAWPLLVAIVLVLALAWWWRRRRAASAEEEALPEVASPAGPTAEELAAAEPALDLPLGEIAAEIEPEIPSSLAAMPRPVQAAIPAATPELLPDDAASVRQRYIAERFPEVARGSIDLADPESVIKGARLFYEDGELPRAVELLQYTIETDPDEPRPWLALFEIFRLERLGGEFSQLAARFRERFGESEHWAKVRFFGREVDPGNALYRDEMPATLETIGPREARRLAAQNATYDPVTENWLRAPMDFQNEVLATELRRALMADAALGESDLAPNPMTALRDIEMFTVA